jgi:hypothetical protein
VLAPSVPPQPVNHIRFGNVFRLDVCLEGIMQPYVCTPVRTFCILGLILGACTSTPPPTSRQASPPQKNLGQASSQFIAQSKHSPPFARMSYEPFSRAEAVAIAEQEWRLFGQRVDDDPPLSGSYPEHADNPERSPGYWERIGEYWWLGQDADRRESAWTGMHDETGNGIDERHDDYYAWSAAFISYVMRTAGAGPHFPYAPAHYVYINIAKETKLGRTSGWAMVAERVDEYPPVPGDVICFSREKHPMKYEQLPAHRFASHCDIVISRDRGRISVIGGNVDHAVTMKHIPITTDGRLADSGDSALDRRYHWFVVLRILYAR